MKELLDNNYKDKRFIEKFSEYEISGGTYEINGTITEVSVGKGKNERDNGETVKAVNTDTKVKITYELIN